MQLCRFQLPGHGAHLGVLRDDQVFDLTASGAAHWASMSALLRKTTEQPLAALLAEVDLAQAPSRPLSAFDQPPGPDTAHLLPPVDGQEVWAAGVTYAWSREARVREAVSKDIYVRVYEAERPEIFFKSLPEKVVGPRDWIGLRGDSKWNVPEPELALILNPAMEIVGFTVGNDVSSRDIEGENPLYLPQAKMFRHSCALGPAITVADGTIDGQALAIRLTITRSGDVAFAGETSTARMHRRLAELAGYLGRDNDFPNGAVLLTGAGIVPDDEFTLRDGDEVAIEIEGIGVLHNTVRQM